METENKSVWERLKPLLPYLPTAVLMILLPLIRGGSAETAELLIREVLLAFGGAAAVGDAKNQRVPNRLVLLMAAAWVIILLPQFLVRRELAVRLALSGAVGGALSGLLFLIVYLVSRKGLGGGDVKFMAVAGLYLGYSGVLPTMLIGSVLAGIVGLVLILTKKMDRKGTIPLIPFLYVGIAVTVFLQ